MKKQDTQELEILQYNHLEHFKAEKDIGLILPIDHPRRVELRTHINDLTDKIQNLKNKINKK